MSEARLVSYTLIKSVGGFQPFFIHSSSNASKALSLDSMVCTKQRIHTYIALMISIFLLLKQELSQSK